MQRERFLDHLGPDEWPHEPHEPVRGHSINLGQFALLVKKDNGIKIRNCQENNEIDQGSSAGNLSVPVSHDDSCAEKSQTGRVHTNWPANATDDWCPPGTSIVSLGRGSTHTCSDKICRWNILGIQGSVLSSLLEAPLYLSTLTVGRKLTSCICRRAVCCRAGEGLRRIKEIRIADEVERAKYDLHHPAIMGTSVCLDQAVIETKPDEPGQDVRFYSTLAWAGWSSANDRSNSSFTLECINGLTGFLQTRRIDAAKEAQLASVSTQSLIELFWQVLTMLRPLNLHDFDAAEKPSNLADLRRMKLQVSPLYENMKDWLLSEHPLLRDWKRRGNPVT